MEKKDMLEMLVNYYSDGNKARFAAKLGIKPQAFSMWLSRNSFDAELIYTKCENVSADWLLSSGEGEMIRDTVPRQEASITDSDKLFYQQQIKFLNERVEMLDSRNAELEREILNQVREKGANVG